VRELSSRVAGLCLVLLVAGCSAPRKPTPLPYVVSGDLCGKVDQARLTAALGPVLSSRPAAVSSAGTVTQQDCSYQFGEPAARIPVEVSIQMTAGGVSIADYYQGLRRVAQTNGPVSAVAGLGQDAYSYTNGIGSYLVTYDRNLYLSYAVVTGALAPGQIPTGIDAAEVASARATLIKLGQ
jgi:hypothetical protein